MYSLFSRWGRFGVGGPLSSNILQGTCQRKSQIDDKVLDYVWETLKSCLAVSLNFNNNHN